MCIARLGSRNLMFNAIDKFRIEYQKVSNEIHPTKFTDEKGNVLKEISASDVGVMYSENNVADTYLLDELFYDSELEKQNIEQNLKAPLTLSDVVIFKRLLNYAVQTTPSSTAELDGQYCEAAASFLDVR